jgi:hypothetical protein
VVVDVLKPNVPPKFSFGRTLAPECVEYSHNLPCNLYVAEGSHIVNTVEGYLTIGGNSSQNQLYTAYDSGLSYIFLSSPQAALENVDFVATTVAVNTQCRPIGSECKLRGESGGFYNCSPAFEGAIISSNADAIAANFRMQLFNDPALQNPLDGLVMGNTTNPVYIALLAIVDQVNGPNSDVYIPSSPVVSIDGSDIVEIYSNGLAFILLCNSTIYNATYSWMNGSFHTFIDLSILAPNTSLTSVINIPQQAYPDSGFPYFVAGATKSIFSNTTQQLAALVYSQTILGLVAGSFVGIANVAEETRQSIIASQVPYAPFYCLVTLNLLCATIGACLTIFAIRNRPNDVVNSLFSVSGLTASVFEENHGDIVVEKVEDLFQEYREAKAKVVGVERTGSTGNWKFKIWKPVSENAGAESI